MRPRFDKCPVKLCYNVDIDFAQRLRLYQQEKKRLRNPGASESYHFQIFEILLKYFGGKFHNASLIIKGRLQTLLHIGSAHNNLDPQIFFGATLFKSKHIDLHLFTSKTDQNSVRYSVGTCKSYFTNIAIQNINKGFVYIKDCKPSLK